VHPFSVDEGNEADRSEEQSADEVGTAEDWHGRFLS
jgi:hypothetical protein